MNICTLKRRLNRYGLKQKRVPVDEGSMRNLVRIEMAYSGEQSGYQTIWHALRLVHKVHPPREMVAKILRELDPAASQARRARKLTRRKYYSLMYFMLLVTFDMYLYELKKDIIIFIIKR